ncbi:hypothetical protein LTR02_004555 [Friedmanniomyces endolithicus]|nr:hypothetical protein LTR38_015912 [Friedmanniomyces endolithicus]KAK0814354.1 hypothetical protein LTR59_000891 [Friedmanniomyces endolithicus]KAK0870470.1 hypothetical protein LTS02_002500 [Friedmanniomyces endolithicus]KAK0909217.1 hypothetical protein LTR02_004555 [Friedmanniomyces endolithicus]KAK1055096.1 hypothetical protein LTS16_000742 [Friedmanniomyces endolithicus]
MAQGQAKKTKAPATKMSVNTTESSRTALTCYSTQRIQTGNRVIKPKKVALQKQQRANKKHTSGLTAMTEKSLAGRAGHLELLRGGKKDRKEAAIAAAAKQVKKG